FNMWINGVHVKQAHVSSEELPFDALAEHRENLEYAEYALPDPKNYLVEGTNIIAIQLVNEWFDRSSDCFIDVSLYSRNDTPESELEIRRHDKPLKYEINALWESEEITSFTRQITIPPDKLVPGHTYRVRVKMKD